jgi:nicotinic acid phosphoribosyltransferase
VFLRPFCQLLIKGVRHDSPPYNGDPKRLTESLRNWRSNAQLTQDQLAARLDISRETLKRTAGLNHSDTVGQSLS